MRISTAYQFESMSSTIDASQAAEFSLQQELSTGKRINQPSDDPYGNAQALSITAVQSALGQYSSNLNYAKNMLSLGDSTLSATGTVATQAYQLAVQAANSTTSQSALSGMVSQVNELETQLVSLANTQNSDGQYIYAGQATQAAPYSVSGGSLVYAGDGNNLNVGVGPGQTMAVNTDASATFTNLYSQLESLKSDLAGGNYGAISNVDIANLQSSQSAILQARGAVGAKLQTVSALAGQNTLRTTELTSQLSSLTDADVAQVATQYQAAMTAYQAAVAVGSQISTLSLANYISPSA